MGELRQMYDLYDHPPNAFYGEEDFLRYRPGGFHPVMLGDTLKDGRYKIYHKLGYGGFSTVWVARDHTLEKWVSVKITRADMTNQSRELRTLRALEQCSDGSRDFEYIVQLLDDFVHKGPNGYHQCLVFELLGPTVCMEVNILQQCEDRLDTDTIVKISTQMLQAIAFMHKAGYIHGDLSTNNLAFCHPGLSRLSEEELFKVLGLVESDRLKRVDGEPLGQGIPNQVVESTKWAGWPLDDDEDDENIRIIDLGEAFHQDAAPSKLAQPSGLQAPETIFADKVDYRLDLWRAGLVIHHLIFGTLPYSWWGLNSLVESMIAVFGELPPEWVPKWEQMRADAAARGDPGLLEKMLLADCRLESEFDRRVHEPELKGLLPVIQGLTKLRPSDRISASQALQLIRDNCGSSEDSEGSDQELESGEVLQTPCQ